MTLLVTGTSGHLGRLTVHALLARGVDPSEIVATARRTDAVKDLADLGVETRAADYDDPDSLADAFAGVDRVLLISGSEPGKRVTQHRNAVDAAAAAGVSLLGYTSILGGGSTGLALAAEHAATEEHLAASGVPHVLLRNGWYWRTTPRTPPSRSSSAPCTAPPATGGSVPRHAPTSRTQPPLS